MTNKVIEEQYGISPRLHAYLQSWYKTSTGRLTKQGMIVELTFDQFVKLFKTRQLKSLEEAITSHRLRYMQRADNPWAYVLTWVSRDARTEKVFNQSTALICSRQRSKQIHHLKAGDKHRPETLEKMRKPKSEAHRASMRKPKTTEHKAKMAQAARERWARVRAAKENNQ